MRGGLSGRAIEINRPYLDARRDNAQGWRAGSVSFEDDKSEQKIWNGPMTGPESIVSQFGQLLPLAVQWAAQAEEKILREGVSLTDNELLLARKLGVREAVRVRLLSVPEIVRPEHPALRRACEAIDFLGPATRGLTLGFGIFIRMDCWGDRALLAHELVHTQQYERDGGLEPFLQDYLMQCLTVGYSDAPLEQEAVVRSAELLRQESSDGSG